MSDLSAQLDALYDFLDDLLIRSKFAECNAILEQTPWDCLDVTLALGALTITRSCKDLLPRRALLYRETLVRLAKEKDANVAEETLRGLE